MSLKMALVSCIVAIFIFAFWQEYSEKKEAEKKEAKTY